MNFTAIWFTCSNKFCYALCAVESLRENWHYHAPFELAYRSSLGWCERKTNLYYWTRLRVLDKSSHLHTEVKPRVYVLTLFKVAKNTHICSVCTFWNNTTNNICKQINFAMKHRLKCFNQTTNKNMPAQFYCIVSLNKCHTIFVNNQTIISWACRITVNKNFSTCIKYYQKVEKVFHKTINFHAEENGRTEDSVFLHRNISQQKMLTKEFKPAVKCHVLLIRSEIDIRDTCLYFRFPWSSINVNHRNFLAEPRQPEFLGKCKNPKCSTFNETNTHIMFSWFSSHFYLDSKFIWFFPCII